MIIVFSQYLGFKYLNQFQLKYKRLKFKLKMAED